MKVNEFIQFVKETKETKERETAEKFKREASDLFQKVQEDIFTEMKTKLTDNPELKSVFIEPSMLTDSTDEKEIAKVLEMIAFNMQYLGYATQIYFSNELDPEEGIEISWDHKGVNS